MKTLIFLALPLFICAADFDGVDYAAPAAWTEPKFEFSGVFPTVAPPPEALPWATIDPATSSAEYMQTVIGYCLEGNVEVGFAGQNNTVRKWYHAPWLEREFVHGLTNERGSRIQELAATQTTTVRNFAVGFYNARGAHSIGRVWEDAQHPDATKGVFAEGTVSFKLLFTTASVVQVPTLDGAPTWVGDINRQQSVAAIKAHVLRLLQVDIAVKDARSKCGGWVFGTFHYDKDVPGATPWHKLRALTLVWGNDPTFTPADLSPTNKPLQSWLNDLSPFFKYRNNPPADAAPPRVFGWAGRGNGPVDNPVSSCLSCHMTAQSPPRSGITPPGNADDTARLRWFRNLAPGQTFDAGTTGLDFSLQMARGIENQQMSVAPPSPTGKPAPPVFTRGE